jgi:hypothetical protein
MSLGLSLGLSLRSSALAFSPLSLFAAGEQGYWLDPSDFSTMFQDDAGSTPVTAVGQSVRRILDKSKGLTRGPELVTNGGPFSNTAGWSTSGASLSVLNNKLRVSATAIGGSATQTVATVAGATYQVVVSNVDNVSGNAWDVGFGSVFQPSTSIIQAANGMVSLFFVATSASTTLFLRTRGSASAIVDFGFVSVRELPGNHFTQSNVANAPLLQVDSTGRHFLLFDGSDDFLQSAANINPGAVDKAQVFAGVRKLSDAARGVVVESSTTVSGNTGTFALFAPDGATPTYSFFSRRSTTQGAVSGASFASPITNVIAGLSDIAAPSVILRINGTQSAINTSSQGAGNYDTHPHFIGRRGGTSLPFNGRLYQLITRFGANLSADQIAAAEAFVNQRTGAF